MTTCHHCYGRSANDRCMNCGAYLPARKVRAALAAAPLPASVDREALVEVIVGAMLGRTLGNDMVHAIADALLARGMRLPDGGETMAWAVTTREGRIDPHMLFDEKPNEEEWRLPPNGKVLRVAIRVVEGGDDA